ncbi:hypothetical protein SD71_16230 [Cohnella kolymensis]|uniref:Uncharacterized protein n=1 Tax=Cohnella kolymensis TaxID=1590652 RepID=A0ABR5A278_9BACL|nr:hypothetical protein [Cohnella kolymensis]KIL35171.1 hypothetical protein SD71_16230 [Cohnella kolymensis]
MRINDFALAVGNVVQKQYDKVVNLATNINGGWEVWMQCEIFLKLHENNNNIVFDREVTYDQSTLRADFTFVPLNAPDTKTWVELKVLKMSKTDVAVVEFMRDITKGTEVKRSLKSTHSATAMLVVPVKAWDALKQVKETIADISKIGFIYADKSSRSAARSLSSKFPQESEVDGKALVLYYTIQDSH